METKKKVTPHEIEERLIEFASRIIDLVEALPKTASAKHLGGKFCAQEPRLHSTTVKPRQESHEMTLPTK